MAKSTNFSFVAEHSLAFDRLGHDLERFLYEAPDLSLFRARQLVEVVVHLLEVRHGIERAPDLDRRIDSLGGIAPSHVKGALHRVRIWGNEAVHESPRWVVDSSAYHNKARKALIVLFEVLVWLQGELTGVAPSCSCVVPHPSAPDSKARRIIAWHQRLDHIEILVDDHYALQQGERLLHELQDELDQASQHEASGLGDTALEGAAIRLRVDSIDRSVLNHKGVPTPTQLDEDVQSRVDVLIESGEPNFIDEAALLLVRTAVGHLNALQFGAALGVLGTMVDWQRQRQADIAQVFGSQPVTNGILGRILGTRGQALAFQAHGYGDLDSLRNALGQFEEARHYFSDAADVERQDAYRAHGLIDQLRLFPDDPLALPEREWLDRIIASVGIDAEVMLRDPLLREHPHAHAFRVALALKHAYITETRPTWLASLRDAFVARVGDDPSVHLDHPFEQILGYFVLLRADVPKSLQALLDGSCQAPGLLGHIARTFRLEQTRLARKDPLDLGQRDAYRGELPEVLHRWWEAHDLGDRLERLGEPGGGSALA